MCFNVLNAYMNELKMIVYAIDQIRLACSQLFVFWVIFHAYLSSAVFLSKSIFLRILYTIRVLNSLYPDQPDIVGPDLGPNCLQRLSADKTRRGKELIGFC